MPEVVVGFRYDLLKKMDSTQTKYEQRSLRQ
jgi:hypothetical protein